MVKRNSRLTPTFPAFILYDAYNIAYFNTWDYFLYMEGGMNIGGELRWKEVRKTIVQILEISFYIKILKTG